MKAYLAGPEVFFADRHEAGERKKRLCEDYGIEGLYPLDAPIEPTGPHAARRIFEANLAMIRRCDMVIANLTPFRGVSADVGTAAEVGLAFAMGKTVHGYSNAPASLFHRTARNSGEGDPERRPDGFAYHRDGMSIEEFGLADNLMLIEAIRASGGAFHLAADGDGSHDALDAFRACVAAAAPTRIAMRG